MAVSHASVSFVHFGEGVWEACTTEDFVGGQKAVFKNVKGSCYSLKGRRVVVGEQVGRDDELCNNGAGMAHDLEVHTRLRAVSSAARGETEEPPQNLPAAPASRQQRASGGVSSESQHTLPCLAPAFSDWGLAGDSSAL